MITVLIVVLLLICLIGPWTPITYFGPRPVSPFSVTQILLAVVLILVILELIRAS